MLEAGWCFALWPEGLHTSATARHTSPHAVISIRTAGSTKRGSESCCHQHDAAEARKRQKPDPRQQWRDGNSDKPRCSARARQQTIRTVNAGMAQSVTTLSPLIKHGSWAGVSIQSVMMKNAMRVKAFMAALNLHALAARRILWRMVSIIWCAGLIALSALGTAQAQTNPIRARRDLPSPLRGLTRSRSLRYLAGRCMIDSRKLGSLLRAPAMSQFVGSIDQRRPRRV